MLQLWMLYLPIRIFFFPYMKLNFYDAILSIWKWKWIFYLNLLSERLIYFCWNGSFKALIIDAFWHWIGLNKWWNSLIFESISNINLFESTINSSAQYNPFQLKLITHSTIETWLYWFHWMLFNYLLLFNI